MSLAPVPPPNSVAANCGSPTLRAQVPAILTIPEAAAILTVSRRTLANLLACGRLKAIRIGRRRVITRAALEELCGTKF